MKKYVLLFVFPVILFAQTATEKITPTNISEDDLIITSFNSSTRIYDHSMKNEVLLKSFGDNKSLSFDSFILCSEKLSLNLYQIRFIRKEKDKKYSNIKEVIFIIDGREIKWPIFDYSSVLTDENLYLEQVLLNISKETYYKLAVANKVSGRIGKDKFKITYDERLGLRALIASL